MRYIKRHIGGGAYTRRLDALAKLEPNVTTTRSNGTTRRSTHHTYTLNTPLGPITLYGHEVEPFLAGYYTATGDLAGLETLAPPMTETHKWATDIAAAKTCEPHHD